jgi:HKD family nuclease
MKTTLVLQDSNTGRASATINGIVDLTASAEFGRMRVAVAYASRSGCEALALRLREKVATWEGLQKRWLVSIDFGRTDAEALEYLQCLPNSEVRVPDAEELLRNALVPYRCFHPKTVILDCGAKGKNAPFAIFVGSGNLTLSGLHTGVEHGTSLAWLTPLRRRNVSLLEKVRSQLAWWNEVWDNAVPVTEKLLTRYGRMRPRQPKEEEVYSIRAFASPRLKEVDAHPGVDWAHARCFWIRTPELYKNRGKSKAGNQLDTRRGTRVYFGFPPDAVPRNTILGSVTLQYGHDLPSIRSIRFGNNQMDKVNLPIPGQDGPDSYDNTIIHFEKINGTFHLKLGSHLDLTLWRKKSKRQGMLYELYGGREFGFYN